MSQLDLKESPRHQEQSSDAFAEPATLPDQKLAADHSDSIKPAPGTGRRLALLATVVAILLAVASFAMQHLKARDQAELQRATAQQANEPPTVDVVRVALAPPTQVLKLPGESRGWYTSTIYARVSGYVAKWLVDIGDRVAKDQVLAVIDTPELDAQLDAAKAQLKASEAEVKVKAAEAEFARTTYERWEGSPKGVVSEQEREDKKAHYISSAAQLNAAQARVNLDRANVDRLTYMTHFKQVTAPYDGVITERRVDIGDLVTAGSTANTTPLFGIAQYQRIRVFVNVPQSASVELPVGTVAHIVATAYPDRRFEGRVARTSQSIDPRARTLRVEIDLPNPDLALLPGMYLEVEFQLEAAGLVQVPASALLFRTRGPQVAVVGADGHVRFQDVSIARDDGKYVEIASGLADGDRVALNISNQIADGDRVSVRESAKTATK